MKRTYIPTIKKTCKFLQYFVGRYKARIEENAGPALYAMIVQMLEFVDTIVSYIDTNSDPSGNYDPPI